MNLSSQRLLLHLGRDRRRAIDAEDVYYLEATGETTLVRLRSSKRLGGPDLPEAALGGLRRALTFSPTMRARHWPAVFKK